jgi:hypothetical protein
MHSKKSFMLSFLALVASVGTIQISHADSSEIIFQSGLKQLIDTYNGVSLRVRPNTPYRDIKLACATDIFLEWQKGYLNLMKHTPLTISSMALEEYGDFMAAIDATQRQMNSVRRGIVDRIHQEIAERRVNVPGFPAGASGLTFTAENIHQAELLAAMPPCANADFDKQIDQAAPAADMVNIDMTLYKVTWKQSTAGGIEPEWTQVSGPNDGLRLFHLLRPDSLYQSFWNAWSHGDVR